MLPRKGDLICYVYVPPHWQVFQPDLPVFIGCAICSRANNHVMFHHHNYHHHHHRWLREVQIPL